MITYTMAQIAADTLEPLKMSNGDLVCVERVQARHAIVSGFDGRHDGQRVKLDDLSPSDRPTPAMLQELCRWFNERAHGGHVTEPAAAVMKIATGVSELPTLQLVELRCAAQALLNTINRNMPSGLRS